jgi:hypothetical protein
LTRIDFGFEKDSKKKQVSFKYLVGPMFLEKNHCITSTPATMSRSSLETFQITDFGKQIVGDGVIDLDSNPI